METCSQLNNTTSSCITSLFLSLFRSTKPGETDSATVPRKPSQEGGGILQQVDLVVPAGEGEEDMVRHNRLAVQLCKLRLEDRHD